MVQFKASGGTLRGGAMWKVFVLWGPDLKADSQTPAICLLVMSHTGFSTTFLSYDMLPHPEI